MKNLTIEHALIKHNLYNINVTWAAVDPEFQPLHYNVSIIPLFSGSEEDFMNELYDIKTISVPGVSSINAIAKNQTNHILFDEFFRMNIMHFSLNWKLAVSIMTSK